MKKIWFVVTSACQATIYNMCEDNRHLNRLESFSHEESRLRNQDLVADRSGHYQKGAKQGGSFTEAISHKTLEAKHFAKEIADHLEKARLAHEYNSLIIIAEPHFHGLLNKECSAQVQQLIKHHVAKDYTQYPQKKLEDHLKSVLEREIGGLLIS